MSRFLVFLKRILPGIFLEFTVLFVFFVIANLSGIDTMWYSMGFGISIFVTVLFLIVYYIFFKKEELERENFQKMRREYKSTINEYRERESSIKSYFMMWVHQIKTPITAVNLMLDDEYNVDKIKIQMRYIEDYTNMALTFIKMLDKNKDMYIDIVDLDRISKEVIKKFSTLFIYSKVKLEYTPIQSSVYTDPKWATIMIEQIVSNAIKYSQGVSEPTIKIYFDAEKNSLAIEDNGIGIKNEDIPRIFERGYSGFNGSYNQKSSGIGLYLVKEISQKLNVKIEVKSELGKGTKFDIIFPYFNDLTIL